MSHKLTRETIEKLLGDNLGLIASGYIPDNLEYEVLNPLKILEIKEDIEKITRKVPAKFLTIIKKTIQLICRLDKILILKKSILNQMLIRIS